MDPQADTDNVTQRKRKLANVVIGFLFLLSGIEYAVILPTVWMYLQTLDAQPFFLGLVLSAFSLTELLSGPLFGHWSDCTGQTKKVLLLSNCFEIAGNFMYFVGLSKWFLLGSRLVAGVGAGAGSSIFGYLTRYSSSKERVPVFAMAMACRQAGLLIGPAFNIFLRYCTFQLGPFHVDKFSAPGLCFAQKSPLCWLRPAGLVSLVTESPWLLGNDARGSSSRHSCGPRDRNSEQPRLPASGRRLAGAHGEDLTSIQIFMCALWTLMQLMVIFMFSDLPLNTSEPQTQEHEPLLKQANIPSPLYGTINGNHEPPSNQDDFSDKENAATPSSCPTIGDHLYSQSGEPSGSLHNIKPVMGLLQEAVVVLLTTQFVTFFNQTALETLVTPLAQTYLGFQDLQNSLLYFLCGIEMLIGFLAVRILSRCSSDRLLLAFGLFIGNISCIWCLVFLAKPKGSYGFLLAEFVVGVFLQVLGLPLLSVSQVSLFSKITAEKTQGFNHGLRRSVGGVATILGPLWAAGLIQNLYIMLGVMMGLLLLNTVMVILSYKHLEEPTTSEDQSS